MLSKNFPRLSPWSSLVLQFGWLLHVLTAQDQLSLSSEPRIALRICLAVVELPILNTVDGELVPEIACPRRSDTLVDRDQLLRLFTCGQLCDVLIRIRWLRRILVLHSLTAG